MIAESVSNGLDSDRIRMLGGGYFPNKRKTPQKKRQTAPGAERGREKVGEREREGMKEV